MENRDTYNGKTPFYMTYPMQNLYLAEMEYEKDMERMKELYPKEVKELQQMIEHRVDEMEYEGSRIYDENPDGEMLRRVIEQIYRDFLRWYNETHREEEPMPMPPPPPMQRPTPMPASNRMQAMEVKSRFALHPPKEWEELQDMDMGLEAQARSCDNPWLCGLVDVLFYNEIYRRRCRNRRCSRWW